MAEVSFNELYLTTFKERASQVEKVEDLVSLIESYNQCNYYKSLNNDYSKDLENFEKSKFLEYKAEFQAYIDKYRNSEEFEKFKEKTSHCKNVDELFAIICPSSKYNIFNSHPSKMWHSEDVLLSEEEIKKWEEGAKKRQDKFISGVEGDYIPIEDALKKCQKR